jgi:hypothetical protein
MIPPSPLALPQYSQVFGQIPVRTQQQELNEEQRRQQQQQHSKQLCKQPFGGQWRQGQQRCVKENQQLQHHALVNTARPLQPLQAHCIIKRARTAEPDAANETLPEAR